MPLLKYMAFINSLLTQMKQSQQFYKILSVPVGYAYDLAAATLNMQNMDRMVDIVYAHGRTLRYNFNVKKSGVLVFGECPREQNDISRERVFCLGPDKVDERDR